MTRLDRLAPKPILETLRIYTRWVGGLASRKGSLAAGFVRRWLWQITLAGALVAAIFLGATYLAGRGRHLLPELALSETNFHAALWLAAVLISLPMLIAIFRKFQALGMLIAELSVPSAAAGDRTTALRGVVTSIIVTAGTAAIILILLLLSSALLPPLRLLFILIPVAALVGLLLRRQLIRLYAGGQIALKETLAPNAPTPAASPALLSPMLRDAHLETVTVTPSSPAAGKVIGDLRLRTLSGASIVAIEREGARTINPGPDAQLLPGDVLLLLGDRQQLENATALVG